jgi:predicted dehydrogenase
MAQSRTRREFVKSAAVTGVGLGVAPGLARAATLRPAASDRVAVAVMGTNGRGAALATVFARQPDAEVAFICDVEEKARANGVKASLEAQEKTPKGIVDFRTVLDDPEVDALVIAAPDHWHAPAAILALQAGKHVYLEKPATHSLPEGPVLVEAWKASGTVVEVGTQRRSHPGLEQAIASVRAGEIGTVAHARCYSWKRRPPIGPVVRGSWPATLDPELWFGPREVTVPTREQFHYDWHWFTEYGNGGLGNNGVHRLDVARWGMGLPVTPDRVMSVGGRLGPEDAGETPNTAMTVVAYGERTVAHDLRGLPTAPEPHLDQGMQAGDEVVFVGDGASIVVSRTGGRLVDDRGR